MAFFTLSPAGMEQATTISDTGKISGVRPPASPRAAASIVFACVSLFLWRMYGQVHSVLEARLFGNVKEQLFYVDRELVLAYFILAGLAAIWCIWSWFTESRVAAIIATVFTFIAVALVTTMSTHLKL